MNTEIIGGLKQAVAKGESLQQAMMSFINSGYPQHEVQESARQMQMQQPVQNQPQQIQKQIPPKSKIEFKPGETKQRVSEYGKEIPKKIELKKPVVKQKVSDYGVQKPKGKGIIILLVALIIFLLGGLFTIFLFRPEIINFLNGLFG